MRKNLQSRPRSILFIVRGDETVPSCRFRAYQFREPLQKIGIRTEYVILEKSRNPIRQVLFHLRLIPVLRRHGAVVFQKLLEPKRIRYLRLFNDNVFFDFDDAMYAAPDAADFPATMQAAPRILAGNETLAARARAFNPNVIIIPTTVPLPSLPPLRTDDRRDAVLSWIGTSANLPYLEPVLEALEDLHAEGIRFLLSILTEKPERAPVRSWIRTARWTPLLEEEEFRMCDIGLMPLEHTAWCAGKCACKALQYLSYGKPVVTSPVGMNLSMFENKTFGLLATNRSEWKRAIKAYLDDPGLRRRGGAEGRAFVQEHYNVDGWAKVLAEKLLT